MGCGTSKSSVSVILDQALVPTAAVHAGRSGHNETGANQYTHNLEPSQKQASSLDETKNLQGLQRLDLTTNSLHNAPATFAEPVRTGTNAFARRGQGQGHSRSRSDKCNCSSDSDSSVSMENAAECYSYADGYSIATAQTMLTYGQSVVGECVRPGYLERRKYDDNANDSRAEPPEPARNMAGEQTTLEAAGGYRGCNVRLRVQQRMRVHPKVVYRANHFWWPSKRMLFSSYEQVKAIDFRVSQVPASLCQNPDELVAQLKRYCEEDVEVARALYRWVANTIVFLPETNSTGKNQPPKKVLKEKNGTARELSFLYQYLCKLAGLECEVVEGLCKQVAFYPGQFTLDQLCKPGSPIYHAWNKVWLCRRWYLLDVALAKQGCNMEHGAASTSTFAEEFFLSRPADLVSTHFPMTSSEDAAPSAGSDTERPGAAAVDVAEWAGAVVCTAAASEWNIKPLSHQRGVIDTHENEVWLQFACPNVMEYHVCLEEAGTGVEHRGYTLIYLQEDVVTVYIRLPGMGVYAAHLQAMPCYVHPGAEGLGCKLVALYTIRATGRAVHGPFSATFDGLWGVTPQFQDAGCRLLSAKGAELATSSDGRVCIDLRLPSSAIFPNLVWFCRAREEGRNLAGFVYAEREGRLVRLHLICPDAGEYIALFEALVGDPTRRLAPGEQWAYARFFITCQLPANRCADAAYFPYFENCLCGCYESIEKYGLWLPDENGSTIYAQQGCCQFLLRQDRPVKVVHHMDGELGVVHKDSERWIFTERNGYDVLYHIRISEPGRHKITLKANEYHSPGLRETVCVLMVDACVAYAGDLYPECDTIWGVEPLFHELGLCSDLEEKSEILVQSGQAEMRIRAPQDMELLPRLFHANDADMDMVAHRVAFRDDSGIGFYMTLPFKGHYRFDIHCRDQRVASYLLSCKVPMKPVLPYEPFAAVYGTTAAFRLCGMKEMTAEKQPIRIAQQGKCSIRHCVPGGFAVHFCLVRNSAEIVGCVYAERLANDVIYHIELQQVGYYRFTCWSCSESGGVNELLFSYLLFCAKHELETSKEQPSLSGYPELSQIWGLNHKGVSLGVVLVNEENSTLRMVDGLGSLRVSCPSDLEVTFTLEQPRLSVDSAKRCIFVEHKPNLLRQVSISVPFKGRYALKMVAKAVRNTGKLDETEWVEIGTFLVISMNEAPGAYSFPAINNLYEGCKLGEPKINPLSAGTEYFFQFEVPGANKVQMWDGVGHWKIVLRRQHGSDVISGMVNVGDPKELWVAGIYDPDHSHGNGGLRELLMYEVV